MNKATKKHIVKDIVIILASLIAAYFIVKIPIVDSVLEVSGNWYILTAFVAGLFFTSVFTTAPAIAFLAKLGALHNPFIVAFVGGAGAVIGDFIIFRFLKDHLASVVTTVISTKTKGKGRLAHLFHQRLFRWSLALLGGLIIASPFPDEIGLALMGLSDISFKRLAIISYTFNTIGILVIAFIARAAIS